MVTRGSSVQCLGPQENRGGTWGVVSVEVR